MIEKIQPRQCWLMHRGSKIRGGKSFLCLHPPAVSDTQDLHWSETEGHKNEEIVMHKVSELSVETNEHRCKSK